MTPRHTIDLRSIPGFATVGIDLNPIDWVTSAADGLWDLATKAANSLADVAVAIGGAFGDVGSAVWSAAKSAASFVGQIPGINILVHTFDEATHLLRTILDNPITAICVVALAAALNVVGLGGPLLAEYAALRLGMDLLCKLEDGDTFTILDVAKVVATAVQGATGIPANLALSAGMTASNIIQKAANGQPLTVQDAEAIGLQAAAIGAAASGDVDAVRTVQGVTAATNVVNAGITAKDARSRMPANLDPNGATKLPGPVVRHMVSRVPDVAVKAGAPDKAVSAVQDAQSALVAASRFSTYVARDYGGPDPSVDPWLAYIVGVTNDARWLEQGLTLGPDAHSRVLYLAALAGVPALDVPAAGAPLMPDVYDVYTAILDAAKNEREALLSPGDPLSKDALDAIHYWQTRLGIANFDPPDPRTASHVPVQVGPVFRMTLERPLFAVRPASFSPDVLTTLANSPAPAPGPSAVPASYTAPLPARSISPYPPIGLPEPPPPYTAPVAYGPKNRARDIGS
jgi:hypothetical protein